MWRSWLWAAKHKCAACVSEQPYPAPPYMVCYGHTAPIAGLNSMPEWYSAYLQTVNFQKREHISCCSQCMLYSHPPPSIIPHIAVTMSNTNHQAPHQGYTTEPLKHVQAISSRFVPKHFKSICLIQDDRPRFHILKILDPRYLPIRNSQKENIATCIKIKKKTTLKHQLLSYSKWQ